MCILVRAKKTKCGAVWNIQICFLHHFDLSFFSHTTTYVFFRRLLTCRQNTCSCSLSKKIRFFKIILLFVLIFLLNQEHLHPSSDLVFPSRGCHIELSRAHGNAGCAAAQGPNFLGAFLSYPLIYHRLQQLITYPYQPDWWYSFRRVNV